MAFSSIKTSPYCKCGCGRVKKLSMAGYATLDCMPERLRSLAKYQTKAAVMNASASKRSDISKKAHDTQNEQIGGKLAENALNKKLTIENAFFEHGKRMTGKCENCGGKTCKGDPKYQKFSQAHILAKSIYISVADNMDNFVELCFWGNSCHTNFDNNGYEYAAEKMPKLWAIIVQKVNKMYPIIKEKSKLPDILIQEINTQK